MSSVRTSLVFSISQRAIQALLTICSFIVLARLLSPEDIGLFSIASALVGIAQVVREFGIGGYLIQERELTIPRIRTAFTLSACIGCSLAAIVYFSSGAIGSFYKDARLSPLVQLMTLNFVLIPFGSIGMTILSRELAFGRIFLINVVSTVISFAVSITLAVMDFGPWTLVWSSIAGTAATCMLAAMLSHHPLAYAPSLGEWRRVIRFGSRSTAAAIITEIAINANDLLIGRAIGVSAVSIMSRAQGLINLFHRDLMSAIRSVAAPTFAKAARSGEDLEGINVRTIIYVTSLAWPFYGFISLFPLELLRLLFGPQWDSAAPIVPILALAGAVAALHSLIIPLITGIGRIDLALRADLLAQTMRIVLAGSCAVVAPSLTNFAIAHLIATIFGGIVLFWLKGDAIKNRFSELFNGLRRNVAVTAATLAGPIVVGTLHRTDILPSPWATLILAGACATVTWLYAINRFNSPIYHDAGFVALRKCARRVLSGTR